MHRRLRVQDLLDLGIVRNTVTLKNWIRDAGFPQGQLTGPRTRTWSEAEVERWIANRPPAAKPPPKRPPGRPRKAATDRANAAT